MRLPLIAHAGTAAMREGRFPADEPLDAEGARRAAALAGTVRTGGAIWTSPAHCARQTALALGLDALVEPALRDVEVGRWAGRSLASLMAEDATAIDAWLHDPAFAPPGGESFLQLLARTAAWLERHAGPSGRMVVISHAAVIRAAIVQALGAPASVGQRIDVASLTAAILTHGGRHWRLRCLMPLSAGPAMEDG
jgi:broad specificity phosphatase PhoE